jgi:hypothetical protein
MGSSVGCNGLVFEDCDPPLYDGESFFDLLDVFDEGVVCMGKAEVSRNGMVSELRSIMVSLLEARHQLLEAGKLVKCVRGMFFLLG